MNGKKIYPYLLVLILINLIVFIPAISLHPSFLTDDYYIFAKISQDPSSPISLNPAEEYFLFVRPLSYFSFWLDFLVWNISSSGMKITSLLLHLMYVSIFFFTILRLKNYLKLNVRNSILVLAAAAFSLYPDHLISIIWISNRTELLSTLFYSASIYAVFAYLTSEKNKNIYLTGYFGFYVLSILSKQQGLHLPLLVIALILIFKQKLTSARYKRILYVSLAALFLTIVFSAVNYFILSDIFIGIWEVVRKKPFALIGIISYIINPIIGAQLHSFFILHKTIALVLAVLLLIPAALLLKRYKINVKIVLLTIIVLLIIFYPRLLASGQNRINSIQVYWFYIAAFFLFCRFSKAMLIFSFIIFINFTSILINFNNDLKFLNIEKKKTEELSKLLENSGRPIYVVACTNNILVPYQLYFFRNNEFGCFNLNISSIGFRSFTSNLDALEDTKIACSLDDDNIVLKTVLDKTFLEFSFQNINNTDLVPIRLVESELERKRTYKSLTVKLPEKFKTDYSLIYFDGKNWNHLN